MHLRWLRTLWAILLVCTSTHLESETVNFGSRDPLDLIDHWDNRPAAFFASAALALATICTNISANSFSAANDLTALFPRVSSLTRQSLLRPLLTCFVVYEHHARASLLRIHRRLGVMPVGDPCPGDGLLEFHGRLYDRTRPDLWYHDCRCEWSHWTL